jgi:hypothetical protein
MHEFTMNSEHIEYIRVNDAILIDGKVVILGNMHFNEEWGGFGQHTIWYDDRYTRFAIDGFANKILTAEKD